MNRETNFIDDIRFGKSGTNIFVEDFLEFKGLHYFDVQSNKKYQLIDVDYVVKDSGLYEVKTNYKDDGFIIIEECSTAPGIYDGWFYKTKADIIVFISKQTRTMIFLQFTDMFKQHYKTIRYGDNKLIVNKPTYYEGKYWQSAYRKIPLSDIKRFYSIYKKC